jgi:phospholipid/cholesterol/gamma-HCH transport system substrate-binding protein
VIAMTAKIETRRSLLLRGAIYLVVVGFVLGALVLKGAGTFDKTFPVTTEVPTVGAGLPVGALVKLRGLQVGRVSGVKVRTGGAEVSMELDPELAKQVPAAVESRVLTANIFGVPFIDLVPTGAETPALARHAVVKADPSAEAATLATLYETAYDVLIAIEPAKLNSALTAIADTMRGNGDEIGMLLEQSASYLSELTPHRAQFDRDLVLLERILTRTQVATPALLDAVEDTAHLARVLVENRQGLADLLAVGRQALDTTEGILKAMEPRLIAVLQISAPVFEALAANQGSPRATLLNLGSFARGLIASKAPEGGVLVRGLVAGKPFPTYTAADCPRYGTMSGPNCGAAAAAAAATGRYAGTASTVGTEAAAAAAAGRYAGTASTVGTEEELATLGRLTGSPDPRARGLVGLVAGPALRGRVVATP